MMRAGMKIESAVQRTGGCATGRTKESRRAWQDSSAPVSGVVHFFFQAEDGIRDVAVTGVQTCALPISQGFPTATLGIPVFGGLSVSGVHAVPPSALTQRPPSAPPRYTLFELFGFTARAVKIGRASCRERV